MIRVAVLGAGRWGPNLIRNFHDGRRSEVLWVVDPDAARLEQVRERLPEIQLSAEAEPALLDSRVDAAVIAAPTSTHYPLAKAALSLGKHVLVEKPMATEVPQCLELCQLAAAHQRVLLVGHVFVYNPGVRRVKQVLEAGDLGRVYYISTVRTNLGPIRVDVNAAWDLASHDISIVNYWLGTEPCSVSAVGGAWINSGIEDAVFATLRYPGDVLASLHASWLNPRKARDITLVGDRRMLTFDDMNLNEPVRIYDKRVTEARSRHAYIDTFASFRSSIREGDIIIPKVTLGEPLQLECDDFLDCVLSGKTPAAGGAQGLAVVRVLEALQRSVRNGGREEQV
jgi:predicted dehydrogenase